MSDSRVNPRTDHDDPLALMLHTAGLLTTFPQIEAVENIDILRALLIAHRIDLSAWGMGSAKTVEHLWEEIEAGEIWLAADPFRRVLTGVAQVVIRRASGDVLVDAEQVFGDGRRRTRNRPPTEKMLPGEHYTDAALRCLAEEMSIGHARVTLLPDTHRIFKEIRVSQSYPGLLSQYTIHRIEAQVAGLPGEDFYTLEDGNGHESVVREHLWRWQPGGQWLT